MTMTRTEQIKRLLKTRFDMDLVGVAAASALAGEPKGHRPEDLLPGAQSILVFGRALADGAVQSQLRALEDGQKSAQSSYAAYAGDLAPNMLLVNDGFQAVAAVKNTFHFVLFDFNSSSASFACLGDIRR